MSNNLVGNWVIETTSTTGTGALTLTGTEPGGVTFSDAINVGKVWYAINEGNNYEAGLGTYNGGTLERTTVHATLIGGTLNDVNPTAMSLSGAATVKCTFNATAYRELLSIDKNLSNNFLLMGA